jgi:ADP-ribosyl-[dinitrogen reductase] hydrolase
MKKIATLVGCAIGDALGNPFETKPADNPKLVAWDGQFQAGGTFWVGEPGQYTDDTLMSIALATSLVEHNGFNAEDVAQRYLAWMESGNTRGIGGTTAAALHNIKNGMSYLESGLSLNNDGTPVGGNGTAMRASPIGLAYRHDLSKLLSVAVEDASITHNSDEPKMGSIAVALGTALLAMGDVPAVKHSSLGVLPGVINVLSVNDCIVVAKLKLAYELWKDEVPAEEALAEIGTRGYVPETVAAAFYCLAATDNFKDCVVMAVKGGGDTDTTAAIVGAMAGTLYGLEGIPEEYKSVENFELLQDLTDELINIEI